MKGKKVLITAGPTKEFIDPVRFISNASTGKMGYAIAEEFHKNGADVVLISGPVSIETSLPKEKILHVTTAIEMLEVCKTKFPEIDIAVFTAAVADYRPKEKSNSKIKKKGDEMELLLVKNPDIALEFGKVKTAQQLSVGFALETDNLENNALEKLKKKNFNLIVLNSPNKEGEGFGFDTNRVSFITLKDKKDFELKSKKEIAKDLLNVINDY